MNLASYVRIKQIKHIDKREKESRFIIFEFPFPCCARKKSLTNKEKIV